jgi:hypothetical protein
MMRRDARGKFFGLTRTMWTAALLLQLGVAGALLAPRPVRRVVAARGGPEAAPLQRLQSTNAPMYDGTNYTLPDASTAAGAAALLEVSFVNACLQLAGGYVDTLKLFIASATGAFECGLTVRPFTSLLRRGALALLRRGALALLRRGALALLRRSFARVTSGSGRSTLWSSSSR